MTAPVLVAAAVTFATLALLVPSAPATVLAVLTAALAAADLIPAVRIVRAALH